MRLKSFDRTAVLSWCPIVPYSHYVVTGSIVGSLGDDFSASSKLEIFSTKKQENGDVFGSVECPDRFSQLAWSNNVQISERGLVAGAMVDGSIGIWNMDKVFESKTEEACVATLEKHTASVKGLEFNPKQSQLLASAGEDGQLYIWNLKQLEQPTLYSLGGKNPHANQVISHLAWNTQIETLLATTSHNGLTVVWDLKQKRPLVPISNSSHKKRYSAVSWNPEVPLQLAVASEDDEVPVIEIWDIRQAFAPLKELRGHTKGCLSLSWCPDDGNLLMSSGRDNRTLFWNPSSGDLLGELPLANSWVFDAKWSPRPSVLSTCSFDGKISVYSLQEFNEQASDNSVQLSSANASLFKTAPKWLKRPAGASFGFGNRLVSFSQKEGKVVRLDQVYRDEAFAKEANQLESTLQQRNFEQFCQQKAAAAQEKENKQEAFLWHILQSSFIPNLKQKQTVLLDALGFQGQHLQERVAKQSELQEENKEKTITIMDPSIVDDLLKEALILSNFEMAVQICLQANRFDDALVLAASHGNAELWQKTREAYFAKQTERPVMKQLSLLLNGRNLTQLVEQTLSLDNWRDVLAMIIAHGKDAAEWKQLTDAMIQQLNGFEETEDRELALTVCSLLSGNIQPLIQFWFQQLPQEANIDDDKDGLVIVEWIQKSIIIQEWNQITHPNTHVELPAAIQGYIQQYARKLSEHGLLNSSLRYYNSVVQLNPEKVEETVMSERFRIYHAVSQPSGPQPVAPFVVKPIMQVKKPQQPVQQPQQQQVRPQQQQQQLPQQQQQFYAPQTQQFVPQQQQLPQQVQTMHPSIYPSVANHPSPYLTQQTTPQQPFILQPTGSASNTAPTPYMPTAPQLSSTPQQQPQPQQGTPYMPQAPQQQPQQVSTSSTTKASTPTTSSSSSSVPVDATLSQMDISKVNQKYQRVVQVLLHFFETTFNDPNAPATLQPKKRIIQNDLKSLFQALNENQLHERLCDELLKLADALESRNNHDLDAVVLKLSTDYWNESKGFIKGFKFIQSILK